MLTDYFYWQYVRAPAALGHIIWNLQRALWRLFSVEFMLRTLLAHWHKDIAAYTGGTLSKLGLAFTWNLISRGIGFLVRTLILVLWLAAEAVFLPAAAAVYLMFLAWPLLVLASLAVGIGFLLAA